MSSKSRYHNSNNRAANQPPLVIVIRSVVIGRINKWVMICQFNPIELNPPMLYIRVIYLLWHTNTSSFIETLRRKYCRVKPYLHQCLRNTLPWSKFCIAFVHWHLIAYISISLYTNLISTYVESCDFRFKLRVSDFRARNVGHGSICDSFRSFQIDKKTAICNQYVSVIMLTRTKVWTAMFMEIIRSFWRHDFPKRAIRILERLNVLHFFQRSCSLLAVILQHCLIPSKQGHRTTNTEMRWISIYLLYSQFLFIYKLVVLTVLFVCMCHCGSNVSSDAYNELLKSHI